MQTDTLLIWLTASFCIALQGVHCFAKYYSCVPVSYYGTVSFLSCMMVTFCILWPTKNKKTKIKQLNGSKEQSPNSPLLLVWIIKKSLSNVLFLYSIFGNCWYSCCKGNKGSFTFISAVVLLYKKKTYHFFFGLCGGIDTILCSWKIKWHGIKLFVLFSIKNKVSSHLVLRLFYSV